jgi:large subunit ribosomal protein L19
MNPKLRAFEQQQMKKDVPAFKVGDTLRIAVKVEEGDKTRTQNFEGVVIRRQGSGVRQNFTLRRVSFGEGVERNFPLHSPTIQKIELVRSGKVRRSKLYYLRQTAGKKGRIEEERRQEAAVESPSA